MKKIMTGKRTHIFLQNGFVGLSDIQNNVILPPNRYRLPYCSGGLMPSFPPCFADGVLPVADTDGTVGFLDEYGQIALPFCYEGAMGFVEGRAAVKSNGKWGLIDREGKVLVPFRYDAIHNEPETAKSNRILAARDGKFGYITLRGEEAIPFCFDNPIGKCQGSFSEGLAAVVKEGKKIFIDRFGHTAIIPQDEFNYLSEFHSGYAMAIRYGEEHKVLHGFLDRKGELAVPVQYEQLPYGCRYSEGVMGVSFHGKLIYTDIAGEVVLEPPYRQVTDFHCGIAWGKREDERWESFALDGTVVAEAQIFDQIFFCDNGRWIVRKDKKYGCLDRWGHSVFEPAEVSPNPFCDLSDAEWILHSLDCRE